MNVHPLSSDWKIVCTHASVRVIEDSNGRHIADIYAARPVCHLMAAADDMRVALVLARAGLCDDATKAERHYALAHLETVLARIQVPM
jgi:hypothetical protein